MPIGSYVKGILDIVHELQHRCAGPPMPLSLASLLALLLGRLQSAVQVVQKCSVQDSLGIELEEPEQGVFGYHSGPLARRSKAEGE